jgi:ectoine hydroxylase-related dioxygenase (phytanoyl-CoA dioxygenase family)
LEGHDDLHLTSLQLFLGRSETGTPFHCANVWNVFVMIEGAKKWTLVDPRYSYFMYPRISQNMTYVASYNTDYHLRPSDQYPLFRSCPTIEVVLEPGDVLLNPPWWWHTLENLSAKTVAVATRWRTSRVQIHNTNVLFDFMQMIKPTVYQMMPNHSQNR